MLGCGHKGGETPTIFLLVCTMPTRTTKGHQSALYQFSNVPSHPATVFSFTVYPPADTHTWMSPTSANSNASFGPSVYQRLWAEMPVYGTVLLPLALPSGPAGVSAAVGLRMLGCGHKGGVVVRVDEAQGLTGRRVHDVPSA
ncbi:hypothetical protein FIBSPDRAFT_287418 [Athelia psychrophila]|uniref:Uncharacterized protein n=1 Tax=Athelia psychrophila TaxID=1759441 RepID=A0A167XN75_9AGAM|nr:hypothetical protein FIBSPDRAFT_287418 [Fibularhizoctonia sp. CBS 109695]